MTPLLPDLLPPRDAALTILAVLAVLFALHRAAVVVVPLLLGLMLSYALTPLVNRLVRLRAPRTLAAALLLLGAIGGVGGWPGRSPTTPPR